MRDKILDAAERRMRAVGYNAVSFRELATDVSIKSASIHYHFPQKEELGAGLVDRYAARFKERLEAIDKSDPDPAIASFLRLYANALTVGESMCLCAVLGAEANGLPAEIRAKVGAFFQMNVDWLDDLNARHALGAKVPPAVEIVSALEGAMIVSTAQGDRNILDGLISRFVQAYARARP